MKIGLLNPWKQAAENQLIPALARAAAALGHTVVECTNTRDVLDHRPDFVLSMSRTQPKLTDIPTYGLIFDPRDILLEESIYLAGMLSFDGMFTIFETLHDFLTDLLFAAGRDATIGYFYPTAPIMSWAELIDFRAARLAYFGINWDRRRHGLFALLDQEPWMEIYGPECGWRHLGGLSYQGMVPFDGVSVLERYRKAGAGLCLFSDSHVSDNIVTSRVFEICAAEAVVIAPRMPWVEQQFGDAVLYIDQDRDDLTLATEIGRHLVWIREHPDAAHALAVRSHRIFRDQFSLDVLLPNVIALHERVQAEREASESGVQDPLLARVSIVLPCFGASAAALRRSLDSLLQQGACTFDVYVILAQDASPSPFASVLHAYKEHFENLSLTQPPVPWQSTAVLDALGRCIGDFIAVLPAGDTWLPGHVRSMLRVVSDVPGRRLARAGAIVQHAQAYATRGGNEDHRRLLPFPFTALHDDPVTDALQTPIGSLLFHRTLVGGRMLTDPKLGSAYGPHLILVLLEQEAPVSTMRATTIHEEPPLTDPHHSGRSAAQDIVRLRSRFVGRVFPVAPRMVELQTLQSLVERGETRRQLDTGRLVRRDGVAEYRIPAAFERLIGPESSWEPVVLPLSRDALTLSAQSRWVRDDAGLPLVVVPPAAPWADGLVWRIVFPEERPYVVRITCRVESGTAGFGVLSAPYQQLAYRVFASNQGTVAVIDLPIRHPGGVEGLVIQSTLASLPVRVVVLQVQVFAARARFPLADVERFVDENAELRLTLNTIEHRREVLEDESREEREAVSLALAAERAEREAVSLALAAERERELAVLRLEQQRGEAEREALATELAEYRRPAQAMWALRQSSVGAAFRRVRSLLQKRRRRPPAT